MSWESCLHFQYWNTELILKVNKIASLLNTGKQIPPLWAASLKLSQTELDLLATAKSVFHYIKSTDRFQYTTFPISHQKCEGITSQIYSDVTTNSSVGVGGCSALCLAQITRRMDIVWNQLYNFYNNLNPPNGFRVTQRYHAMAFVFLLPNVI